MKILILGRLFSGLADGLARGEWAPRGVPAFYKLVEGLHSDPEVELCTVLFCKDPDPRFDRPVTLIDDKAGMIEVVPWRAPTGGRIPKLDRLITELDHLLRAVRLGLRGADLIFATYGMVLPAAMLARFFGRKVVLRLMGLFPQHRAMARGQQALFRWAMRAPFAEIICTEDGSDPAELLPRIVAPGTAVTVRLNGCDVTPAPERTVPDDGPLTVLFLGRLESYKGADLFVEAALACKSPDLRFELVGDGALREVLEHRAAGSGIVFHGALPHTATTEALRAADIYVSINLHGNLSNANLEALAAGCALVLPSPDRSTPIDLSTERLIPADAAIRYDREDIVRSLTQTLLGLCADRAEVIRLRQRACETASDLLRPWTERINADKQRLKSLAAGRAA